MPDDRTVLDHLLEGRDALVLEVDRLRAAIAELDAVIGQIGGGRERLGSGTGSAATTTATADEPETVEPVNPPAEVEPDNATSAAPPRPRRTAARKAPAKRAAARQSESPKSIRVHVLEMLASEDRDFGLAEIIDRVHGAGIQAHDDAVRSITIKLMKDGRVERVGRGQYRLAQRGAARHAVSDAGLKSTSAADTSNGGGSPAGDTVTPQPVAESPQDDEPDEQGPQSASFTPPLNLGQPWDRS